MNPNLHPDVDDERREALYRTLDRLRTAAGVRDPDVEITPPGRRGPLSRLAGVISGFRIVVNGDLLDQPEDVRAWHLARVLSWWTTPQARRWHWLLVALVPVAVVVGTAIVVALLAGGFSPVLLLLGALLLTGVMVVAVTKLLALRRRALDEGGLALLQTAGYPPPP